MGYVMEIAARELLRRQWRSFFVMVGYALATGLAVGLVSIVTHSQKATGLILSSTGTHFIIFTPACEPGCGRAIDNRNEGFISVNVPSKLLPARYVEDIRKIPAVRDASPYLLFRFRDEKLGSCLLGGFDVRNSEAVGTTACASRDIVAGRFLTPQDTGTALLEESFAKVAGITAGQKITVLGRELTVCGVVNPGVRPAKADIYVPIREAETLIQPRLVPPGLDHEVSAILVEVRSAERQNEAMEAAKNVIPGSALSSYACHRPAAAVKRINEGTAWLLIAVTAVSVVLLSMKAQAAAVSERRRDFAILRVIGWSSHGIFLLILTEALWLALAGGALGCGLAWVFLTLAPAWLPGYAGGGTGIPVLWNVMKWAFLASLGGGLVAGLLPALGAARMVLSQALRRV